MREAENMASEEAVRSEVELRETPAGLVLTDGEMELRGDFDRLASRIRPGRLQSELVVKAARIKGVAEPVAIDATAGLGEDALLLAAAGFRVRLYERDPLIAALLRDALARGRTSSERHVAEACARMDLVEGDSISALRQIGRALDRTNQNSRSTTEQLEQPTPQRSLGSLGSLEPLGPQEPAGRPDVVLLDPMFPARSKSAAVKKKFQLIHHIEKPCDDEEALLEAAIAAGPRKVVIKRPPKGPHLAGVKPAYSLTGKAVRYDCLVYART